MNLSLFIAKRYFLSKRKKNFINIISILSMIGVAFSCAALIIVLSVFNGLEDLLRSLNSSFDPELKIEAVRGKSFEVSDEFLLSINRIEGVEVVTEVIEDYGYLRYGDADMVVTMKGVSDNFIDQHRLDEHIVQGRLAIKEDSIPLAVIGRGVQTFLSISLDDSFYALQVFYVKNVSGSSMDPSRMYARKTVKPAGVFSIEKNYDENYILLPISLVEELVGYDEKRTALEVKASGNIHDVQTRLKKLLGDEFDVLNNEEQHKDLYRLLKVEKLFTFLALSLLVGIASINIFFSLMMLALDKKKDISVLYAMGSTNQLIRKIFLAEGAIISFLGAGVGLLGGGLICWLQTTYGLVGMGLENAVVSNYPVQMKATDFLLVASLIFVVTLLISFRPASLAAKSYSINDL